MGRRLLPQERVLLSFAAEEGMEIVRTKGEYSFYFPGKHRHCVDGIERYLYRTPLPAEVELVTRPADGGSMFALQIREGEIGGGELLDRAARIMVNAAADAGLIGQATQRSASNVVCPV